MAGPLSREQEQAMFAGLQERADFKNLQAQQHLLNLKNGSVPASNPHVVKRGQNFFNARKMQAIENRNVKIAQKTAQKSADIKEKKKIEHEGQIINKQIELRRQLQSHQISQEKYDEEVLKLRSNETLERLQASRKVLPAFDSHALDALKKKEEDLKESVKEAEKQIAKRELHLKERLEKKEITDDEYKKLKDVLDESAKTQRKILQDKEDAIKSEKKTIQEEGTGSQEELLKQRERDFERTYSPISIMPKGTGKRRPNEITGGFDSRLTYEEQKGLGVEHPTATIMIKEGPNKLIPVEIPVISKADLDIQRENLKSDARRRAQEQVAKEEEKSGVVDFNNMSPDQKLALLSVAPKIFSKEKKA